MTERYRKVGSAHLSDPDFLALEPAVRLCYHTIIEHPSMTSLGLMRMGPGTLADWAGVSCDVASEALERFEELGYLRHRSGMVSIPTWEPPENPKVIKGYGKLLAPMIKSEMVADRLAEIWAGVEQYAKNPESWRKALMEVVEGLPESLRATLSESLGQGQPENASTLSESPGSVSGSSAADLSDIPVAQQAQHPSSPVAQEETASRSAGREAGDFCSDDEMGNLVKLSKSVLCRQLERQELRDLRSWMVEYPTQLIEDALRDAGRNKRPVTRLAWVGKRLATLHEGWREEHPETATDFDALLEDTLDTLGELGAFGDDESCPVYREVTGAKTAAELTEIVARFTMPPRPRPGPIGIVEGVA